MPKLIIICTVLIYLSTIIIAESSTRNGYHINRPNLAFTLPVKSSFRIANSKLRHSLPQRNYGAPIGQAPPSPHYANPNFINPTTDNIDLGLQIPTTTIQPEYIGENQDSIETFDENQNGEELGRLINKNKIKSARQEVEQQQQPKVSFQFQIPQYQNGFAHALAVYNPPAQQQQLIAQYQPAPVAVDQQQLLAQYPYFTSPYATQYQIAAPVQQQVFGNLQSQAILNSQYVQAKPDIHQVTQAVQPLINTQLVRLQPAITQFTQAVQPVLNHIQPVVQAVAGQLPNGIPFAKSTTGNLQVKPILSQQFQIQQGVSGKLQNFPARQILQNPAQQQQQEQNSQGFAYAAIGF